MTNEPPSSYLIISQCFGRLRKAILHLPGAAVPFIGSEFPWGQLLAGYKVLQGFRVKLEFKDVSILQIRTAGEYLSIQMIDRTLGLSV